MIEWASKILSTYKADVSDHVAKLKQLKGEERKRAQETIDSNEKVKASLEDQLKTLGKLAIGVGAAYAAGRVAIDSYKFSLERSRLETGAAGVDMERLRKASAGLKSDMDLLRDAVKFKSAAEKMSQKDMEDVEGAMRALVGRGKDATKVNEALTQALTKLSTEGLQELGIHVNKAGLSMDDARDRSELFKRVMKELRTESLGVADAELTKEERMVASGVAFENAIDSIKKSLGEMVIALAPLIAKVAELVGQIAKLPKSIGTGAAAATRKGLSNSTVQDIMGQIYGISSDDVYMNEDRMAAEDFQSAFGDFGNKSARIQALISQGRYAEASALAAGGTEDGSNAELAKAIAAMGAAAGLTNDPTSGPVGKGYKGKGARDAAASAAAAEAKRRFEELRKLSNEWAKSVTDDLVTQLEDEAPDVEDAFATLAGNLGEMLDGIGDKLNAGAAGMVANDNKRKNFLEGAFGPIEDFNRYAAAFGILQFAVTGAMDAWITGSESMGTAVKKAIGAGLKALAADLAIQALKHGAYAIGSLAFGDVRGAALHGTAAAQFAAGSVAAAVAARAMGHGGTDYGKSAGGGAGSAAPGPRPANSNSNQGQQSIVYVVGDPFDTETNPRRRQNSARKIVEQATRAVQGGKY